MLNRVVGFLRIDKESISNLLFTVKFASTVTLVSTTIYSSYVFYKNDFNITRSAKYFTRLHYKIRYGEFKYKKTPDSFFMLSLSEKLCHNISIYFIQLDLDKENGVTYSDLTKLWNQFELDNDHLNKFIADKQSGTPTEKLLHGCTLQTFGEAFESLILKIRGTDRKKADDLEISICEKLEEINKLTTTPENIQFTLSNPYISATVSDICDKLLTVKKSKMVEEAEVKQNILELQTEMLALEKQISQHKSVKKPLTHAEQERIRIAQEQVDELKSEIKKLYRGLNSWF